MTRNQFFWTLLALNLAVMLTGLVNEFYTFCPTILGVPMTFGEWHKLSLDTKFKFGFIIALAVVGVNEVLCFLGWKFLNRKNLSYGEWRL